MVEILDRKETWVYPRYCTWFSDHALPDALPKRKEEIADSFAYGEDVFEDDQILLNRAVYYIPLSAAEAKSGQPEMFGFTELNLMKIGDDGDVSEIVAVEYTLL